ncbi:hypothetical protein [Pseudomonas petrae]|uniref:Uncharacterized protein n=1 Tax=Pseudomonas petrae TaxID=2912190 RepID=A0ABS9IB36_9PSED|nr:hypothetical protein [Pseudomonas petrae]MCF7544293.1 hypothetical protein [Pseudomonas petrae]
MMESPNERHGIFLPIFRVGYLKLLMIFAYSAIAILSFALPAVCSGESVGGYWFRMAVSHIADVGHMASISLYPCTLAGAYTAAMAFAVIVAGAYCFTDFPKQTFAKLSSASLGRRFTLLLFALMVIVAPIIHGLPVSSAHRTYGFFQNVAESRLYIFLWSVGICSIGFLAWVAVFFEISRIFKRSK